MTDLSKIPDLELRQKLKGVLAQIKAVEAKLEAAAAPFESERERLEAQRDELLGERWLEGECAITGLPIFSDDETRERRALACALEAAA